MWYLVPVIVVVIIVVAIVLRSRATPTVAMFQAIECGILNLQRKALADVIPDRHGELRGFDEQAVRERTTTVNATIRFVYSVDQEEGNFLHLISSQLVRRKPKKYQIQCMLVVMLVLNRQLAKVGIKQDEVKFGVDESALGTQYVAMILTPEQQSRLSTAVTAS